ncbi:MAG: tyrosine-type recombinase/integrase [Chitinophagaceae bacterium]
MSIQSYPIASLFGNFIKDSQKGRRLKQDGKKLKKDSVVNYAYCLKLLQLFDVHRGEPVSIRPLAKYSKTQLMSEKKYWKKFYNEFTAFLYKQDCFDNYVGSVIKCLRTFFNWLETDRMMPVGRFHKDFFVVQQEVPIITLMPEQLRFLIYDPAFEACLPAHLQRTKDIMVIGCTVALRYSDLVGIGWHNIETKNGQLYLSVQSKKTETVTRVPLPPYVLSILEKYTLYKKHRKTIFEPISLHRFNLNLRAIVEKAGYTEPVGKSRSKQGVAHQQLHPKTKKPYRFCDLVSSHIMRRTAVTTMLMHGVPEFVVKKISGHASNSKAFYRYVNLAQSFMDSEVARHFEKMGKAAEL